MNQHPLFRFVLVGLANTGVGYGLILLLHYGLGLSPVMANFGGYVIGALLSYGLNRSFTFNSQRAHHKALPLFLAAAGGSYLLNLVVLQFALQMLPFALAQALAVFSYSAAFYLSCRFLVFEGQAQ